MSSRRTAKPIHLAPLVKRPKGVHLGELTATFCQDNDCCDSGKLGQDIKVEIVDGGGGNYALLSSERWAIEPADMQWLAAVVKAMCAEVSQFPPSPRT